MTLKIIDGLIIIIGIVLNYYFYIKKEKKHRRLLNIISILTVLLWLYIRFITAPDSNDYACRVYSYYKGKVLNKVIVVKKINLLHMMAQVLLFKGLDKDKLDTIYFNSEKSNTYNEITKGDTLVKNENSDSLFILRKGKLTFMNQLNCGCDTDAYKKKYGHSP